MAETVPKIRLEGFDDAWEQRKLGELATFMRGERFTADDYVERGGIPSIHYGEIHTRYGTTASEVCSHVRDDLSSSLRYAKPGDVIVAATSENVEDVCTSMAWLGKEQVAIHDDCFAITSSLDPIYLSYFFASDGFFKQKMSLAYGVKVMRVNADSLAGIEIGVPSLHEQDQIASVLVRLDNLITLHQREYDKLVVTKNTFLQRLYPKTGESTTELRFDAFADPYYERQARAIFREYDVRDHAGLPVLSAHQKLGMVPREQIGYEIFHDETQEKTYKHIRPGQFVIHLRSFQGGFAHSAVEGIASPAYTVLEFTEDGRDYDLYWKHLFMSRRFIDSLRIVTYGIRDGRSISIPEFMNLHFFTPAYEEQKAVGDFFEKLDELIALEASQLEKLKQVKSTLLRKMFV